MKDMKRITTWSDGRVRTLVIVSMMAMLLLVALAPSLASTDDDPSELVAAQQELVEATVTDDAVIEPTVTEDAQPSIGEAKMPAQSLMGMLAIPMPTAKWADDEHLVTFEVGEFGKLAPGDPLLSQLVADGETVVGVPHPTGLEGWMFTHWMDQYGECYSTDMIASLPIYEDMTFTICVEPLLFFATFISGDHGSFTYPWYGNLQQQFAEPGLLPYGVPGITSDSGWLFIGWSDGTNLYSSSYLADSFIVETDILFTAQYVEDIPVLDDHLVQFAAGSHGQFDNEYDPFISQYVPDGQFIPGAPKIVADPGWAFMGWKDQNGNSYTEDAVIKMPIYAYHLLTAQYEAINYRVTFDTGAYGAFTDPTDPCIDQYPLSHGSSLYGVPQITADVGWVFIGWSDGTNFYTSSSLADTYLVSGDATFVAQYVAEDMATVIFDYAGGLDADNATSVQVEGYAGQTYPIPEDPTKVGSIFLGWLPEVTADPGVFGEAGSITVYTAQWQVLRFIATFRNWDGSLLGVIILIAYDCAVASGEGLIPEPTRSGYTFEGWNDGVETLTAPEVAERIVIEDVTFTAMWSTTEQDLSEETTPTVVTPPKASGVAASPKTSDATVWSTGLAALIVGTVLVISAVLVSRRVEALSPRPVD
jgi:uncharacterized repeat protein (TIGR02543 family)